MLQFIYNYISYTDHTLPSFSALTYLYFGILAFSLAIAIRSRHHARGDDAPSKDVEV
jgi:hypothetical protein